jgi:hypothetical protein
MVHGTGAGCRVNQHNNQACGEGMGPLERFVDLVLSGVLIVGACQFYFFTQRHRFRKPRVYHSKIDERIPFPPGWAWVYSFLYYATILYLNLIAGTTREFVIMAFSFVMLLGLQMVCFELFPVATPSHWRKRVAGKSASWRFLGFVTQFDGESNCFPSMHASVSTLPGCLAWNEMGGRGCDLPTVDCGVMCIHQAALSDGPARWRFAGLDHLSGISGDDLNHSLLAIDTNYENNLPLKSSAATNGGLAACALGGHRNQSAIPARLVPGKPAGVFYGAILLFTYRWFQFSNLSYGLFTVFLSMHLAAAHYTYAETPFGFWMQDWFGFERNHYDRLVHFSFGLLIAYPFREPLLRRSGIKRSWS